MNGYAATIATVGGTFIFVLVAMHLLVSLYLWNKVSRRRAFLVLLIPTITFLFVWLVVGISSLIVFGFCSFCFGPGSPQWRIHDATFGFPYYIFGHPSRDYGIILVALLLYAFAWLACVLAAKGGVLKRILVSILMAAVLSTSLVSIGIAKINGNPDGMNSLIPPDASQIQKESVVVEDAQFERISFVTLSRSDAIFNYYERVLQESGWVPMFDYTGPTPTPTPAHTYWRYTAAGHSLYLHISAIEMSDNLTHVVLEPTSSLR